MQRKIERIPIKYTRVTKLVFLLGVILFLGGAGLSFAIASEHDFSRKEMGALVVGSMLGAVAMLAALAYEALIRLEQLDEQQGTIIERESIEDADREMIVVKLRDLRLEVTNLRARVETNDALLVAEKLKARFIHFSVLVDLFVRQHLGGMQSILKGDRDRSLYFNLESMTPDEGRSIWKAFIASARCSFFGMQYWYTSDSLGASKDISLLEYQRSRANELQLARATLAPDPATKHDCYTRVFVIDDSSVEKNSGEFYQAWLAMQAQSEHGITVRFILESEYRLLTGLHWPSIGSCDFCIVDRRVEEDLAILNARSANIVPCLMVVKYEGQDRQGDHAARKTGFEITAVNSEKLAAAQAALKAVMSGNASQLFRSGIHSDFASFKKHVEATVKDRQRDAMPPTTTSFIVEVGGETLACLKCLPAVEARASVLFLHGAGTSTKERMLYLAAEFARWGIASVLFDFSGHGHSTGELRESSLQKRVEEALAIYRREFDPSKPVRLMASSMGGYIALRMLQQGVDIDVLGLFSPGVYSDDAYSLPFEDGKGRFSEVIKEKDGWRKTGVFKALEKYRGKLVLVTGRQDKIVPRGVFEELSHSGAGNREWIDFPDGPHLLHTEYLNKQEGALHRVLDSLKKKLV